MTTKIIGQYFDPEHGFVTLVAMHLCRVTEILHHLRKDLWVQIRKGSVQIYILVSLVDC